MNDNKEKKIEEGIELRKVDEVLGARLEKKLDENISLAKNIYEQNLKIKRRLTLIVLAGYFKFLLIIIPLILGAIYLQPFINTFWQQYNSLINGSSNAKQESSILNLLNNPEVKKLLNQ